MTVEQRYKRIQMFLEDIHTSPLRVLLPAEHKEYLKFLQDKELVEYVKNRSIKTGRII